MTRQVSTRTITLLALWIAVTVALGYALATVPNVELVTASVFLAGYLFGPAAGVLVGISAEFLYSLTSPYGLAAPPLLVAQLLGMAFAGFTGGWLGRPASPPRAGLRLHLTFGLAGLFVTLVFDLITTASFLVFSGITLKKLLVSAVFGLGFYLVHIGWNTLVFATVLPAVAIQLRNRLRS